MSAELRAGVSVCSICALVVTLLLSRPAVADVSIRLVPSEQPHVEVTGLPAQPLAALAAARLDRAAWQRILALYVVSDSGRSPAPVMGDYAVNGDRLTFTPSFPLKPGLRYCAVFDPGALPAAAAPALERMEAIVSLEAPPRARSTVVDAVYPSAGVLPENLLKFYIHFSAPMSRGESYRHIRLLDAAGTPVEAPFLELAEELWDETGRRLTLLLDPGRVKRDLKPHKEVGRALVEGSDYVLVISDDWRDARGSPLGKEFRKRFHVGPADGRQPDPQRWKLTVPWAGTRQPLVVTFDEPLDHAMLQHVIRVSNPANEIRSGRISIDQEEMRWRFRPADPWLAGRYRLLAESILEDLAGNSIDRPFEVYLPASRPRAASGEARAIEFQIRGNSARTTAQ